MTVWIALLAYLALCLALRWWGRHVPPADERHPARTGDGWLLTLHRYRPAPGVPPRPTPVILGHGILMSRVCWELSAATSIPRWLAARGHDVWVAEYRGTASSQAPSRAARFAYDAREHGWLDAPAIVATVRAVTGRKRVSWVGHSMGGIVGYLFATRFPGSLHRLVTIGTPSRFGRGVEGRVLGPAGAALKRIDDPRLRLFTLLTLPFSVFAPWTGASVAIAAKNLRFRERAGLFGGSFQDVSSRLHLWFLGLKEQRGGVALGEPGNELAPGDLAELDVPHLAFASTGDLIAPPKTVRPAWARSGGHPKRYVLFGAPEPGIPTPRFGHNDLMCSAEALQHVWPMVAVWLEGDRTSLDALPGETGEAPPPPAEAGTA